MGLVGDEEEEGPDAGGEGAREAEAMSECSDYGGRRGGRTCIVLRSLRGSRGPARGRVSYRMY